MSPKMKLDGTYPSSIRLPPHVKKSLHAAAKAQGCSISFKILQILKQWELHWRVKQGEGARELLGDDE